MWQLENVFSRTQTRIRCVIFWDNSSRTIHEGGNMFPNRAAISMQFGMAIAKRFMGTWRLYLDWSFGGKLIYIRFGNMFPNRAAISTQFGTAIAKRFMGTWRLCLDFSKSRSDFYAIWNGNCEAIYGYMKAGSNLKTTSPMKNHGKPCNHDSVILQP